MNRMRLLAVVAAAVLAAAIPVAAQVPPNTEPPAPAPEMNPPAQPPPTEAETETDEAANAAAAEPMAGADTSPKFSGEMQLGLTQTDVDTISSKFYEYRSIPNGVVLPFFSFRGHRGDLRYSAAGRNVQQSDQQFAFRLNDRKWGLDFDYNQIPHRFGNDGRTLLEQTGPGVFEMSDTLQRDFQTVLEGTNPRSLITYPFLNNLVSPSLEAANHVDLALERERTRMVFTAKPSDPLAITVRYLRERRTGDRAAAGTAFGFGNVVETPEPVHYLTQDFTASGQFEGTWGSVQAGLQYNSFANRISTLSFDNPFRITDSTDPSAYQAPGSASVGGPVFGVVALPPDNEALTGSALALFRLPHRTRVTASASLGSWRQNETPFIPYSTNTAITDPLVATDRSTLPVQALDGKIDVTTLMASVSSRPADRLNLTARFRRYDHDNQTARVSFPGYVRFDGVWEDIPRISVPYSYTSNRFDASGGYDVGRANLEAYFRHIAFDRTFRETEETRENAIGAALRLRASDWAILRGSFESGSRDFDQYHFEESEEASFLEPGAPVNQPGLRRYDQAKKDFDRINTQLILTPGGKVGVTLGYSWVRDDYTESELGLTEASYQVLSADFDYTPSARWSLYGFYSRERNVNHQAGRQSAATPSVNPLDNWFSDVQDDVDSVGGGLNIALVPDKWSWNTFGRYQKVDGFNDLSSPPGGAPDIAFPIERYDDTRIVTISSELAYRASANWTVGLGGWYEDYDVDDAATSGVIYYFPASFFLAANDGNYRAVVGWLKLTYRF